MLNSWRFSAWTVGLLGRAGHLPITGKAGGATTMADYHDVRTRKHAHIAAIYPFNMDWNPAASVPCGLTAIGLPVGLQIVGRRHDDLGVLQASSASEAALPRAEHFRRFD